MLLIHHPGSMKGQFRANGLSMRHNRPNPKAAAATPQTRRPQIAAAAATADEPSVTVRFVQEGIDPITIEVPSGEQLRASMLENKVDLYTTWGKIWSCGGAGQCGTCIVQVDEGAELLSERTATEDKKLSKQPANWRLACQTIVGDGTNSGSVVIQTKPQAKK